MEMKAGETFGKIADMLDPALEGILAVERRSPRFAWSVEGEIGSGGLAELNSSKFLAFLGCVLSSHWRD